MNSDTLHTLAANKDVQARVLHYIPLAVLQGSKDHQDFSDIDAANWDRAAFGISFVPAVAAHDDFFVKTTGLDLVKAVARTLVR